MHFIRRAEVTEADQELKKNSIIHLMYVCVVYEKYRFSSEVEDEEFKYNKQINNERKTTYK